MHATLKGEFGAGGEARFLADIPDSIERGAYAREARSAYGAARRPNWTAILTILCVHVAAFYALVTFDVIEIAPKKEPLVIELITEPPAPPVEEVEPQPVVVEPAEPVAITPPPIVRTPPPPPPQIAVASAPPPPTPAVAAPAPPAGPVAVGNLEERLIDYDPPRYPFESRRKKEQGTVLLRLVIGTDGRVVNASIAESCGFQRLDQALLQAVRKWRWQPEIRDGQPVQVRGILPFTWKLT